METFCQITNLYCRQDRIRITHSLLLDPSRVSQYSRIYTFLLIIFGTLLFYGAQPTRKNLQGKGFLPFVSSAPKDHHSLLQLYLDGPKDKLFYIFSAEIFNDKKITTKNLDKNLDFLNNKSLNQIKTAQKNAFIKVLKRKKIPFREFIIKDFSEESLGEFFSYFILETALIGKLSNINPFDQPAVEEVKADTKKLLI